MHSGALLISQISFFDRLLSFSFILIHGDSGSVCVCVRTNWSPTSSSESFVTDDWVNGVVLMNILIEVLPFELLAFDFSWLSPMVLTSFQTNRLVICDTDSLSCTYVNKYACLSGYTHMKRHWCMCSVNFHKHKACAHTHTSQKLSSFEYHCQNSINFSYVREESKWVYCISNSKSSSF